MCKLAEIIRKDMSFFGFAGRALLGVPGMIWNLIKTGKAVAKSPVGSFLGNAISNVGSFLGNAISNVGDQYLGTGMTDREREIYQTEWLGNELAANNQRAWEERMSNTAYQRQVADMQAAGVNPALMYSNGSSGASTPSGSVGGASASSASMGDLVGTLLQMTMQNRQLKYQKDIAEMNNATSRANAETAADATKYASDQQRTSAKEGNEIRSREVDQVIKESEERCKLFAEQTNNEKVRNGILDAQKRIEEATATEREAYADRVNDLIQSTLDYQAAQTKDAKASAALKYEQKLLTVVQKNYEEKLWSDDYIDAVIDEAIASSDIRKDLRHQSEFDAVFSRIKNSVVRGFYPSQDIVVYRDGKEVHFSLNKAVMDDVYDSLSKGMGVNGPTSYSSSSSSSYNTQYFGARSETRSSSSSYGTH